MEQRMRPSQPPHKQSISIPKIGLAILAIALFIIPFVLITGNVFSASGVDNSKYQAVFLTNGQAYFGKLDGYGTDTPSMSDVYYFQTADTPQGDKDEPAAQTLVKLGDEIHKPDDRLILNKDAILFVENLSGEGSVVQAIEENQ